MLQNLLEDDMKKKGYSLREVSREIGVSHSTVARILAGEPVRIDILKKFAEYLRVDPSILLDGYKKDDLAEQISALLKLEPGLVEVFGQAMEGVMNGTYAREDIKDVLAYATYRLKPRSVNESRNGGVASHD